LEQEMSETPGLFSCMFPMVKERETGQKDLESISGMRSEVHWSWLQMVRLLHRCFTEECAAVWWCRVTDVGVTAAKCELQWSEMPVTYLQTSSSSRWQMFWFLVH